MGCINNNTRQEAVASSPQGKFYVMGCPKYLIHETFSEKLLSWAPKSLRTVTAATKLRRLLLGRKAMTNLDSILKSRDITLLTKICLVKAMVFLVVMYGCESWTIKKKLRAEELMLLNVVLEKTLESPLDCKEIKPVHPKENQS